MLNQNGPSQSTLADRDKVYDAPRDPKLSEREILSNAEPTPEVISPPEFMKPLP